MGLKEETQALNSLTVKSVGNLLGFRLPAKGMARCPLPSHEDVNPSFEVRGGGSRWICYGCDRRGGAIDLVMEVRGLSFPDAKRWLSQTINFGDRGINSQRFVFRRRKATIPASLASEEIETAPDHEVYATFLSHAPLEVSGRQYLQQRGLNDETIARFGIGQTPGVEAIRTLIDRFGFARVEAAGLLTQKSTPHRFWPIFPRESLLFPYFEAEAIAYLQARLISDQAEGSRWRNLNHRRRRLYNADVLACLNIRRVSICEGAIDVLSATQLGRDAVGLIGVSGRLSVAELTALRGRQVDLLLDWDTAGEKRATTLLRELRRFGIAATRKARPSPSANDVNDYLREVSGSR